MYAIGGILFCLMEGILVGNFGWTALLWGPLGFTIGLFISANMILPILMGYPIAFGLWIKQKIRPAVFIALLRAPFFWILISFLIGFFFPSAIMWVLKNPSLNMSLAFGSFCIILSPLSKQTRQDFRSDFDKAYSKYFLDDSIKMDTLVAPEYVQDEETESKRRKRQIEASAKLFFDLYNYTTSTYKNVFNFKLPDSRFRYMVFCLSVFLKSCEVLIESSDLLLKEYVHFLVNFAMSKENINNFFVGEVKYSEVEEDAKNYLNQYMKEWITYSDAIKINDTNEAATIICWMIVFTESQGLVDANDIKRTKKLILEIERSMSRLRDTFLDFMKIRGGFLW